MAKRRRNPAVDFDDEDAVLAEMAKELDIDEGDLKINDKGRGFSSFGTDTFYEVETRRGSKGWVVGRDDDACRELALASVKQDIEQEPEIFSKGFLEQHINIDRLRRDLHSDVHSQNYDYANDQRDNDLLEDAERMGILVAKYSEEDEDGDVELTDKDGLAEAYADAKTEEDLRDPMQYLEDIYGKDDAVKQAIEIAGIDEDAAAEDAVDTDGWQHFVSSYDGNSYETPSGFVYWRTD